MANNTYTFVGSEIRPISGIVDTRILSAGYIYDDNYGDKINPNTEIINNLHDILSDLKYGISSLKSDLKALILRVETLEGGVKYLITYKNGNIESVSPLTITKSGGNITIDPYMGYSVDKVDVTNCEINQNPVIEDDVYKMSVKNVTGDIGLTIDTTENIPEVMIIKDGNKDPVKENLTLNGNKSTSIDVNLSSSFNGLTTKNGKFTVAVSGDINITNSGTEFINNSTLTIKRKSTSTFNDPISGNKITITPVANENLKRELNITINPILVAKVSINNQCFTFIGTDNKNSNTRNVTLTAIVNPDDTTQTKEVTFSFVDNVETTAATISGATLTVKKSGTYKIKATSKANNTITSELKEFTFKEGEVESVSISGLPTTIPVGGGTYDLTASVKDTMFDVPPPITWITNIGSLSSTSGSSVKLTIDANTTTSSKSISVNASCGGKSGGANGTQTAQSIKYYWYVGQEAVTPDNYTTLNGVTQVTSYPTTYEYTPSKRARMYILIANNKTISKIEDAVSFATATFDEDTSVSINGYKVYKTGGAVSGKVNIYIN